MDPVEEIESAITHLQPEDYRRFVDWFRLREQARWDQQIDAVPLLASWISCSARLPRDVQERAHVTFGAVIPIIHRSISAVCEAARSGLRFASANTIALSAH